MSALKHLHQIHPTARWWLKADGTDIQVGLRESMSNDWSGDVDWGNGDLQQKHKEYLEYVQFVRCMAVKQRRSLATIGDLQKLLDKKLFLSEGLTKAKHLYEAKRRALNVSEDSLFALAWDVEGYSKLVEKK